MIIALIFVVAGLIACQKKDRTSRTGEWLVGIGIVLFGLVALQEDQRLGRRCRAGNRDACFDLEQRQEARTPTRP